MIHAPSLANCNCLTFGQDVEELIEGGVEFFHIDLMDGHYVPNLCLPVNYIKDIKEQYPDVTAEIHLMVTNPMDYLDSLAKAGADYVAIHGDSTSFIRRTLLAIREKGMKAGAAINPSQRIDVIEPYIKYLDYVILMTVEPGFAGQRFLPEGLDRLTELDDLRRKYNAGFLIEVDGGVDYENASLLKKRGADILVTGIYVVFKQEDGIVSACRRFERFMEEA